MPFRPLQTNTSPTPGFRPLGQRPDDEDARDQLVQSQQSQPERGGFLKNMVKDAVGTLIVKPAVRATQAGIALVGGDKGRAFAEKDANIHVPLLGDYQVGKQKTGVSGVKQVAGDALKSASYLVPGGEAGAGVKGLVVQGLKQGAITGGLASAGQSLQNDQSIGTTLKNTAVGAGVGGLTGGAISGLTGALGKIAPAISESAKNTYTKVLSPTTKLNKATSEKIVPELLDRKVFSFTRKGLLDKAGKAVNTAGDALEEGYAALPQDAKVQLTPVLKHLEDAKGETMVNGVVLDSDKFKAIDKVQQDLLHVAGSTSKVSPANPQVSVESARKARQILDSTVNRSGKGFGFNPSDSAALEAKKEAVNSLRNELAQEHPSIAKLNKEFTFWANLQKVVGDTVTRTKGQNPLSETIAETGGAVAGAIAHGTLSSVLLTASGLKALKQAVQSAGFRTASAVLKDQLAKSLAEGNTKLTNQILERLMSGTAARQATTPPSSGESK